MTSLRDGLVIRRRFVKDHASLMEKLVASLPLKNETLRFAGKDVPVPRLTSWHGDRGYRYSGKLFHPSPWTSELADLRDQLNSLLGVEFNSVLANYYRDGKDSVGWHADNEPEISDEAIASVSLGSPRRFILKNSEKKQELLLGEGDLLVMRNMQTSWVHSVPKTSKPVGPRLNLTFRIVKDQDHD